MGIIETGAMLAQKVSNSVTQAAIQAQTFAKDNNGGNDMLSKIFNPVVDFLSDLTGYVYVAVIVAVLAIGIMFLGGQRSREKAKEWIPYVFVGAILAVGAVTIGKSITNTFSF